MPPTSTFSTSTTRHSRTSTWATPRRWRGCCLRSCSPLRSASSSSVASGSTTKGRSAGDRAGAADQRAPPLLWPRRALSAADLDDDAAGHRYADPPLYPLPLAGLVRYAAAAGRSVVVRRWRFLRLPDSPVLLDGALGAGRGGARRRREHALHLHADHASIVRPRARRRRRLRGGQQLERLSRPADFYAEPTVPNAR